eukprot:m.328583 g.328583  ORF g.328583 m.328583 type:complete len:58 (+) comp16034_c2_seq1:1726-1899(+)
MESQVALFGIGLVVGVLITLISHCMFGRCILRTGSTSGSQLGRLSKKSTTQAAMKTQ